MRDTIKVSVGGNIRYYLQDIAGYSEHIAQGLKTVSLTEAFKQAEKFFDGHTADSGWDALAYWVWMDDSGLAYLVEIDRCGRRVIRAAAPMPGADNVRELYIA